MARPARIRPPEGAASSGVAGASPDVLRTYQPSGQVGARAWLVVGLVGLPVAAAGGWAMAWGQGWMPGFLGGAIGALVSAFVAFVSLGMVADATHARHRGVLTGFGLVLMSVWLATRWALTLGAWHGRAWAVSAPALEAQLHWGPMLGAVAEAAFVGVMGVLTFRQQAKTPYGEAARAWARQSFKGELWCTQDQASLLACLKLDGMAHLLAMPRAMDLKVTPAGSAWQTLRVTGMAVDAEPSARWVTLTQVAHERDVGGKVKSEETVWLQNWHVSAQAHQALADHLARAPAITAAHRPGIEEPATGEGHVAAPPASPEPATPDELVPALAAFDAGQYGAALSLAQAHRQHPEMAVRADALRLCALALSRLSRWAEAFEVYHALFELEPTALNALQLATTSVLSDELLRGQAWYERACRLNETRREIPPPRLCTNYISALEQAGEYEATQPFLDWLARAYRERQITDDHYLWMNGMPFLSEFLRKSWALQVRFKPEAALRQWYEDLRADLDASGQFTITHFLAEVSTDAST